VPLPLRREQGEARPWCSAFLAVGDFLGSHRPGGSGCDSSQNGCTVSILL